MKSHTNRFLRNALFNSFAAKLLGIILLLAISVLLSIYVLGNIIFRDDHSHFIFGLMVVSIVLFSLASFFIHRVIAPIHELGRGVKEIREGNLDVELNVLRKDEIGQVASAFNQMTIELKKMIQSREQLLLDVSHELRTPITRAKLALEILEDSVEKKSIVDDMKEMELMISELLETEQLKSGKAKLNIKKHIIKTLINEVVSSLSIDIKKINVHTISDDLCINVDQSKIKRVVRNIIENALKYSEDSEKPIEINVIDRSEKIILQIEDYGIGIPEDKLEFIFEPFYRVDSSRSKKTGGYGLGLHMAKKIMEAHDASIQILNKKQSDETSGVIVELVFNK